MPKTLNKQTHTHLCTHNTLCTQIGIGSIELWYGPAFTTIVCGLLSLTYVFSVIKAGGVGKNGSTVAVSLITHSEHSKHTQITRIILNTHHTIQTQTHNKNYFGSSIK